MSPLAIHAGAPSKQPQTEDPRAQIPELLQVSSLVPLVYALQHSIYAIANMDFLYASQRPLSLLLCPLSLLLCLRRTFNYRRASYHTALVRPSMKNRVLTPEEWYSPWLWTIYLGQGKMHHTQDKKMVLSCRVRVLSGTSASTSSRTLLILYRWC